MADETTDDVSATPTSTDDKAEASKSEASETKSTRSTARKSSAPKIDPRVERSMRAAEANANS